MLQWFILFPKFAEFKEILLHWGKTPMHEMQIAVVDEIAGVTRL